MSKRNKCYSLDTIHRLHNKVQATSSVAFYIWFWFNVYSGFKEY